jgi:undecaprenyl-diphosphatase
VNLIDLGCSVADARAVNWVMSAAGTLGHGAVAGLVAIAMLIVGMVGRWPRLRRCGAVGVVAVVTAGVVANLLKLVIESPRPGLGRSSYGFPSGHTTTAFAFAAVIARAYPRLGPLAFLGATLTGLARLYIQAHFTIDVAGGAVVGTLIGFVAARWLPESTPAPRADRRLRYAPAVGAAALAAIAVPFFVVYEQTLAGQQALARLAVRQESGAVIAVGTPEARSTLVSGWSVDERWDNAMPFVWAQGTEATVRLPGLAAADHRLRLRLLPWLAHDGLSCQRMDVELNGQRAGRLVLDRGWHTYEVALPGRLLRPEANDLRFRFAHAAPPRRDGRPLSVAFGALEVVPRADVAAAPNAPRPPESPGAVAGRAGSGRAAD